MMANSSELITTRRFSRKPSFSQTCNRLSQYLKENGSFGDLSLGIACKPNLNDQPKTTMSLFPCEASKMDSMANIESKTLFSRQQSFSSSSSSVPKEDVLKVTHTTRSVKQESQTSPLTIFYNGQVIVFNDFSPEKAKEVMNLAKNQTNNIGSLPNQELVQSSSIPMTCELPIARRASLHRFLEKRKDRVMSKAPYQLCDPAKVSPKPQTSWLGLASEI